MHLRGFGLVKSGTNSEAAEFTIDTTRPMVITVGDFPYVGKVVADFQINASKLWIQDSKDDTANKSVHRNKDPLPHVGTHYTLHLLDCTVTFPPDQSIPGTKMIDIIIPSLSFKRLNAGSTRWKLPHWNVWKIKWNQLHGNVWKILQKILHWNWDQISNGITILFVSMVLMVIVAFALLNSLGALSGSLTGLAGFSGVVILAVPFLSISSLSKLVTDRWKLLSKKASLLLTTIIILISGTFLVVPTLGYLGPSGGVFGCSLPLYPTFPAFLASSQYIDPEQLYQKVVDCPYHNSDWSSLQTGKISTGWDKGKDYPNCVFLPNGNYQVTATPSGGPFQDGVQPCFFRTAAYGDFAYQVKMTVDNQDDQGGGGLVFRTPDPPTSKPQSGEQTMYRTAINVTGYQLDKMGKPVLDNKEKPIPSGSRSYNFFLAQDEPCHLVSVSSSPHSFCIAPMLYTGAGQTNTLTVISFGDKVYFYINGSYVDQASNNISSFGYLGVFANAFDGPSKVIFSDAKEWNLWL